MCSRNNRSNESGAVMPRRRLMAPVCLAWSCQPSGNNAVRIRQSSSAAFVMSRYYGSPGPRARRTPTVNAAILGDAIGQLMRSANVINQFLPSLHGGRAITLGPPCLEALTANRRAADAILEALGRKESA